MNIIPSRAFLSLSRQRNLFRHRPFVRLLLLIGGILAIVVWQGSFRDASERLDDQYSISNTFGGQQAEYVYFFHYLGLYPISTLEDPRPEASSEAARGALREHGGKLRLGEPYDRLTVMSYLPNVYFGGDPHAPSHVTGAWLGFTAALIALYTALWTARLELMGLIVVALVGSNPFQLHEVYAHGNVFGWAITVGLLVTAVNVPLIVNHRYYLSAGRIAGRYLWVAPILSGVILGTFRHLRTECVTTMLAVLAAYTFLSGISWRTKAALIGVLLTVFVATQTGWHVYFDRLEARSESVVKAVGGTIQNKRGGQAVHVFWHPVWGGLGDFDGEKGYLFWDRTMFHFADPQVTEHPDWQPGINMAYQKVYSSTLREKVLSDILSDPLWYATIIAKRIHRTVLENTPPQLAFGSSSLSIPGLQLVLLPFAGLAIACYVLRREWSMMRLMMFPFAIGGVAVAVTSVNGYHYYGQLHLFLFALLIAWGLEAALRLKRQTPADHMARPEAALAPGT